MNTWVIIPSANPDRAGETASRWMDMGYEVALLLDAGATTPRASRIFFSDRWLGYPAECNRIAQLVPGEWVVFAGDDMDPDPNIRASAIRDQCLDHFDGDCGIMQPTGDPFDDYCCRRICGSPWVGREVIFRGGPFHPYYRHFFADEELKLAAEMADRLWQRDDLCQMHHHHSRYGEPLPPHMKHHNEMWSHDHELFQRRKAAGFPRDPGLFPIW